MTEIVIWKEILYMDNIKQMPAMFPLKPKRFAIYEGLSVINVGDNIF